MKFFRNLSDLKVAVLANILPIFLMIFWQVKNSGLPISDANDFISAAARITKNFYSGEIFEGIKNLYSERPWRPVSFHLLLFPFMLISKNNILFTASCIHVLCLSFIVSYSYFLLRIRCDKALSLLGAIVVGLSSHSFFPGGLILFAETIFTPAVIAFIYHLAVSDYIKNKKHAFATAWMMIICFTTRPVEAFMHLLPILILFFYYGYKSKNFSLKLITQIIQIILAGVVLLAISGFSIKVPESMIRMDPPLSEKFFKQISTIIFICALLFFSPLLTHSFKKLFNKILLSPQENHGTYALPAFGLFSLITVIWWMRSWRGLISWVYRTNFGDISESGVLPNKVVFLPNSLSELIERALIQLNAGGFIILIITTLCLIYFAFSLRDKTQKIFNHEIFYLCAGSLFAVLSTLLTAQNTYRKIATAYVLLSLAAVVICSSYKKFTEANKVIFIALIVIQFLTIFQIIQNITPSKISTKLVGTIIPAPKDNSIELEIVNFLNKQQEIYAVKNIILPFVEIADPFTIATLAEISSKQKYNFAFQLEKYDKNLAKKVLQDRNSDALFLINRFGSANSLKIKSKILQKNLSDDMPFLLKLNDEFLLMSLTGELERYDFKLKSCQTFFQKNSSIEWCLFVRNS